MFFSPPINNCNGLEHLSGSGFITDLGDIEPLVPVPPLAEGTQSYIQTGLNASTRYFFYSLRLRANYTKTISGQRLTSARTMDGGEALEHAHCVIVHSAHETLLVSTLQTHMYCTHQTHIYCTLQTHMYCTHQTHISIHTRHTCTVHIRHTASTTICMCCLEYIRVSYVCFYIEVCNELLY